MIVIKIHDYLHIKDFFASVVNNYNPPNSSILYVKNIWNWVPLPGMPKQVFWYFITATTPHFQD
jgi:uncharacterized membrane protein (DUF106 family)